MATGRVYKKKIVDSRRWHSLYTKDNLHPHSVYPILVVSVDPWGMLPADGLRLKSILGPHDPYHTPEDYKNAIHKLHDVGLVHIWTHQGIPWLYVVGHDQEQRQAIRSRKTGPEVPRPELDDIDNLAKKRIEVYTKSVQQAEDKPKTSRRQAEDKPKHTRDSQDLDLELELKREDLRQAADSSPSQKSDETQKTDLVTPGDSGFESPPFQAHEANQTPIPAASVSGGGLSSSTMCGRSYEVASVKGGALGLPNPGRCPDQLPPPSGSPWVGNSNGEVAHFQDKRPLGIEREEILNLQAIWAKRWKVDNPTGLPTGDNLQRVLQALRSSRFGYNNCVAAIYGQHNLASKDNSGYGRMFHSVFPALKSGNQTHTSKLDPDRFEGFVYMGKKHMPKEKRVEKPNKTQELIDEKATRETEELAKKVGIKAGDSVKTMMKKFMKLGKK